jgi:hypothetical protein
VLGSDAWKADRPTWLSRKIIAASAPACAGDNCRGGRVMLKMLLRFRSEIGQVLGLIACTMTVIYFEYVFGWSWYAATPVGVLAFVSMLTLWARFIAYLDGRQPWRGA